ncbi:fluoride efflux transporter CrcB [Stenotrophomonas maltophilia]|uniref:fluoride efflux transporter CrcB n=1 Tax=Stenotrophomonas TaxID=40323 RepID=UPI0006C63319|nr:MULTISPECIES: fluoride efflux transporter CrcB [Stenotrophomonas]KAA3596103.1 fluoride efflux transporter CrcB [Stenotrophomonas maltophilia]KOO78518.1 protein CrcB [Stenotrophomonas maltophilia]MBN5127134.1 fluoride efflux transporter CrcB [Stenotrophomonas maltophilia]MBN5178151.1 fluoride efflux transporter CrcB [Stenotrophomonas maltophilia]MCU1124006.1 fluoride efflux transporter CrcB [Stenotrophomonas maltophilia]
MHALNNYLLVFIGGGLGACVRHACNLMGARVAAGSPWPWSTFLINISGALLMGALVEAFALRNGASPQLRLLLATGILGGYTTFSTYALEIGVLLQRGQHGLAALYAGGSVALGLVGLFAGMKLARLVLG